MKETLRTNLARRCAEEELRRWFDPLHLEMEEQAGVLTVVFPHNLFESWFFKEGQRDFEACLSTCLGKHVAVHYCLPQQNKSDSRLSIAASLDAADIEDARQTAGTLLHEKPFGDEWSLENFIAGKKNTFPLAVARDLLKKRDSPLYNPLVYYGRSGCGKTHILRALANNLSEIYGKDTVFYGNADTFAGEYGQKSNTADFGVYHSYCFDDIHFLVNRQQLQEKLVLLIDICLYAKKQFICTCNGKLTSHQGFSEQLLSRLEHGIIAELKNPDIEVRMRFVQIKCAERLLDITRDQMLFLAQRCNSLRYLSGIISKITAYKKLVQKKISDENIESIIATSSDHDAVTPRSILKRVSAYYSLEECDILGKSRKSDLVAARQAAMYLCREMTAMSYPALGRFFGGKDHSTIIHAIQKIKKSLVMNKQTHKEITELKHLCIAGDK